MRILVTGSSGFVGGGVARLALQRGWQVHAQYRTRRPCFPDGAAVQLHQADLRDGAPDWPHVDMVFHAATNANASNVPAHDLIDGNLRSTQNLLRWMQDRDVRRIVFCSTISAYGEVHAQSVDENTDCINTSVYGMTKLLSESLFREAADRIDCLAVRLPGMLGPNAHGNWLSGVIARIASGRPVDLYNPRGAFNNAAHVSDLFALAVNFAEGDFSGYDMVNICAGSEMAIQELVIRAGLELGKTPDVRIIRARRPSFTISAEKAVRRYGYAPMRLEDMVVRYVRESAEPTCFATTPSPGRSHQRKI